MFCPSDEMWIGGCFGFEVSPLEALQIKATHLRRPLAQVICTGAKVSGAILKLLQPMECRRQALEDTAFSTRAKHGTKVITQNPDENAFASCNPRVEGQKMSKRLVLSIAPSLSLSLLGTCPTEKVTNNDTHPDFATSIVGTCPKQEDVSKENLQLQTLTNEANQRSYSQRKECKQSNNTRSISRTGLIASVAPESITRAARENTY